MQALLGPGAAGGPVTFGIAVVATVLQVLFSGLFGGGVDHKTLDAIRQLRDQLTSAIDWTKRFAWSIGRIVGATLVSLGNLITKPLQGIIDKLRALAQTINKIYTKVIVPMLNALQRIRAMLNDIYNNWVRPIIETIQKVRKVLAIFRIFGLKWAQRLDDRLARIEGKIAGPFLWVVRQLNGYGSWLNVILTVKGAIQRALFINSAFANQGTLVNLWWASQAGQLSGSPNAPVITSNPPRTLQDSQADLYAFVEQGTGPIAADVARSQAQLQTMTGIIA